MSEREYRIGILNRMRSVRFGNEAAVGLVMSMWLLSEMEARDLIQEARKTYGEYADGTWRKK